MSKSTKNSGEKRKKCQPKQPVPPLHPRRLKAPSSLDQRAFQMQAVGMTQRKIAAKLGVTRPTVHRAIARVVKWTGKSNAEDRAGLNAFEKFKVASRRHRIFLSYTQRLAMREFHRSRQTLAVKKQITNTRKVKDDGTIEQVRLEEYLKPQFGRNPYLGTAARASHELTVLAAGYLGPGNGSISCDKIIDLEERDRWDRAVKSRARRVKRLQEKLAAAEQALAELKTAGLGAGLLTPKLGVGLPTPPTGLPEGLPSGDGGNLRSGISAGSETSETRAEHRPETRAEPSIKAVSRIAEKDPAAYQKQAEEVVTNRDDHGTCEQPSDTRPPAPGVAKKAYKGGVSGRGNKVASRVIVRGQVRPTAPPSSKLGAGRKLGAGLPTPTTGLTEGLPDAGPRGDLWSGVAAGSETRAEPRVYRWSAAARQEALGYHCQINRLPPAKLEQASGIPDPVHISPKEAIERGRPYIITIHRTEELERVWQRRQREIQELGGGDWQKR